MLPAITGGTSRTSSANDERNGMRWFVTAFEEADGWQLAPPTEKQLQPRVHDQRPHKGAVLPPSLGALQDPRPVRIVGSAVENGG